MSDFLLGTPPSAPSGGAIPAFETRDPNGPDNGGENVGIGDAELGRALAQLAREQLARDLADIERATAALRHAAPALQSWSRPPSPPLAKTRPLWLLIGALWLSAALVTAGTVAVIACFAV